MHYEQGVMCVGENLPKHTHTLVAAAAIQVLSGSMFRLHGLVSTERWDPNGNTTTEHWREQFDAEAESIESRLRELLSELRVAVLRTRPHFDEQRS